MKKCVLANADQETRLDARMDNRAFILQFSPVGKWEVNDQEIDMIVYLPLEKMAWFTGYDA